MSRTPVTVLTGYLGAGKTTLLNRILSEAHGRRYAVIVNEFGEIGIDGDLVVGADEEVFAMNNGCLRCSVRGDLIRIIASLLKRANSFGGILVETTGLADPAPVAQTFLVDDDVRDRTVLDAIVTAVDACHIATRLKDSDEARAQVASGGDGVVFWPFAGRGGPLGRSASEAGWARGTSITRVAAHPTLPLLAAGAKDGFAALMPLDGAGYVPVLPPQGAAVEALAFSPDGLWLAVGDNGGRAALVDLSS